MVKRCLILFCCCCSIAFGQTVSGKVVDSLQSPIPFATVMMLRGSDSSFYQGAISNEKGVYTLENIAAGNYRLNVSCIGYKPESKSITVATGEQNLPDIILSVNAGLSEVSINAIRNTIDFKNGNITVDIANSPLAKGNTVYDMLFKLPGVSMDDNTIYLNGKPGVVIMIDGRIQQLSNAQLLNLLKSMNTEVVDKIELLKNPPVKYDAAGTSGIIHIKTKKNTSSGFNGSIYTSSSFGFYPRVNSGASLNYKYKSLQFFSNIDYNYSIYRISEIFNKKFALDSGITEFTGINTLRETEKNFTYKFGTDWSINRNNILGFKIDGGPGSYTSYSRGTNTIGGYNNMGFHHLDAAVDNPDKWNINNYNLNSEHHFDTLGTILTFNADYTLLSERNKSLIQNRFLDASGYTTLAPNIYRSDNTSSLDILTTRLDLVKPVNDKVSLEAGIKTGFINTANNYLFERENNSTGNFSKDSALSNHYTYSEETYAAYFNYIRSSGKMNLQLGLRAENTNLLGKNTDKNFSLSRSYYNVFPNVNIDYAASENHNLQFNFNRRIDRPAYGDLTPFRIFRDQYSFNQGNPFLLPHYSSTAEVTHGYKELLYNTLTYTRIDKVMISITEQSDSTKVTTEIMKNMRFQNYLAWSCFYRKNLKKWWNLSANGLLAYIDYAGDISNTPFRTKGIFYTATLINTFLVAKNTKAEINTFYRSGKNGGLVQIKSRWMASCAVKRSFLNKKLDCSIGITDIFHTLIGRSYVKFSNQNWSYNQFNDTRRITASINYNFGKVKTNERETASNEDEKGRANH